MQTRERAGMSRSNGLGSPHLRGDGQPRREPLERQWWQYLAALVWLLFLIVVAVVGFGAVVVGVFVVPGWIVGALPPTLAAGLIGITFTVIGFGALIITAAHPDRWHVSAVRLLSYIVVWVLVGLMGVAMLVYAITQQPGGSSF